MASVMTEPRDDHAEGRRLLVRVASLLYDRRLTELQGGNMSLRAGDVAVVTPTLASENDGWRLASDDALVQTLDGTVLVGDPARVSREIVLHLRLYSVYADVGAVFHLHLPEALASAAAGRWEPGVVRATADEFGSALVLLEAHLKAQTEPHDGRVTELLGQVDRSRGAISISPGHGIFCVGPDIPTAIRAADVLRQRLEMERVRTRLRGVAQRAAA